MTIHVGPLSNDGFEARYRGSHQIVAPCMSASVVVTYPGASGQAEQVRVSDRHVCVIPAGQRYSAAWSPDTLSTLITVSPSFISGLARTNGMLAFDLKPQHASVDPFLWHMARAVERQIRQQRTLETSYVESLAVVIGQHLIHGYAQTTAVVGNPGGLPSHKVRRAIDYIRSNYQEDIGFKDIADELRMSPFHFARMFKHSTAESPQQYIMRCRIDAAKKLLVETDRNIADIALDVGYKSQSYFTTRFAQFVGMTPSAFRGTR